MSSVKNKIDTNNINMVKQKMETAQDRFGDDGHVESPIITKRRADSISELEEMRNAPVVNYELVLSLPDLNSVGNPDYHYRWVKETHKRMEYHKRYGYVRVPETHFPEGIPTRIEAAAFADNGEVCAVVAMACRKDAFNKRAKAKTDTNKKMAVGGTAMVDHLEAEENASGFIMENMGGISIDGQKVSTNIGY